MDTIKQNDFFNFINNLEQSEVKDFIIGAMAILATQPIFKCLTVDEIYDVILSQDKWNERKLYILSQTNKKKEAVLGRGEAL